MRKITLFLMCILLLCSCAGKKESFDGKDRPSSRGHLQVIDGQLCGKDGEGVMLRGISGTGISVSERYINNDTYHEISHFMGVNVIRLALYTYGVGTVGYCTGGDKERLYKDIQNGIQYAKDNDMYVIVDWHILEDGDPNRFAEEAVTFFDRLSAEYKDADHLLYEICNEPNKTDWASVKSYAETVIPVIRKNDPDAVIIVGNPDWSKDLNSVLADPLEYDNLLYTLHFYSASHKQDVRNMAENAFKQKLPVFVSEFGICAASGGFPRDIEEADLWIDLLEAYHVSYCMWNFSMTGEACVSLRADCLKLKEYTRDDFTETGLWLIDTITSRNQ